MIDLLTVHEVAEILRVSYETALMYVKQNNLALKIGRQYRVSSEKLARHLSQQPPTPTKLNRSRKSAPFKYI